MDSENASISVKGLMMSMYEGFRSDNDIPCVHIVNINAALKTTIQRYIDIIHERYGGRRNERGWLFVLVGDQPKFRALFWVYYDMLHRK